METSLSQAYQHWHTTLDDQGIYWLTIDRKNSRVNTINEDVLRELIDILTQIPHDTTIRALVIQSGKTSGFVMGADITRFREITTRDEASQFIQAGQAAFNVLADLPIPTIAMIEGVCLGGGLELALACRYRLAELSPKTKLALPEVKLGIHPGWGGSVRLPALIGPLAAMDMMLTGRMVSAKAAQKMGLVNEAVPKRLLKRAVIDYALNPPAKNKHLDTNALFSVKFSREILGKMLKRKLRAKVNPEHYPAPFILVDNWIEGGNDRSKALAIECNSISNLIVSEIPRNLQRVFFLQEQLKGLGKSDLPVAKHIHVVGAGVMGGDIAAWCALKGYEVTLHDQTPKLLASAMKRAYELATKQLKEKHLIRAMMDRLLPDPKGEGVLHADIIIEAITEKLSAKQALFTQLESIAKPEALLATNTSTIPLEEIGSVLSRPERLVGIHFFNPVAKMPLVEIIHGQQTTAPYLQRAMAFVKSIDKLPLPVKSSPGFLVNRILLPYMLEAITLLDEGYSQQSIDQAALDFGLPMGPIELADTVGLDVCLAALKGLQSEIKGTISQQLDDKVNRGELGRKTGKGFYQYHHGKKVAIKATTKPDAAAQTEITNRLILRILNEAVACLREGIVENADLLDAGCIFGFGFPPFRGGPIAYIRSQGEGVLLKTLEEYGARFGDRFTADQGWDNSELCA